MSSYASEFTFFDSEEILVQDGALLPLYFEYEDLSDEKKEVLFQVRIIFLDTEKSNICIFDEDGTIQDECELTIEKIVVLPSFSEENLGLGYGYSFEKHLLSDKKRYKVYWRVPDREKDVLLYATIFYKKDSDWRFLGEGSKLISVEDTSTKLYLKDINLSDYYEKNSASSMPENNNLTKGYQRESYFIQYKEESLPLKDHDYDYYTYSLILENGSILYYDSEPWLNTLSNSSNNLSYTFPKDINSMYYFGEEKNYFVTKNTSSTGAISTTIYKDITLNEEKKETFPYDLYKIYLCDDEPFFIFDDVQFGRDESTRYLFNNSFYNNTFFHAEDSFFLEHDCIKNNGALVTIRDFNTSFAKSVLDKNNITLPENYSATTFFSLNHSVGVLAKKETEKGSPLSYYLQYENFSIENNNYLKFYNLQNSLVVQGETFLYFQVNNTYYTSSFPIETIFQDFQGDYGLLLFNISSGSYFIYGNTTYGLFEEKSPSPTIHNNSLYYISDEGIVKDSELWYVDKNVLYYYLLDGGEVIVGDYFPETKTTQIIYNNHSISFANTSFHEFAVFKKDNTLYFTLNGETYYFTSEKFEKFDLTITSSTKIGNSTAFLTNKGILFNDRLFAQEENIIKIFDYNGNLGYTIDRIGDYRFLMIENK